MHDRSSPRRLTALLGALLLLAGCAPADSPGSQAETKAPMSAAEDEQTAPAGPPRVRLTTSVGDIVVELDPEKAPVTVENFLRYVDRGFYDGTVFHRVMDGFMIQGGGFTVDLVQKPTDSPIVNEWQNGLKNVRGTIAMGRLPGIPDSASSQFYINVVNNTQLDRAQADGAGYAVFGHVVEGMDVVDAIKVVPTGTRGRMRNVPLTTVQIVKARRVEG